MPPTAEGRWQLSPSQQQQPPKQKQQQPSDDNQDNVMADASLQPSPTANGGWVRSLLGAVLTPATDTVRSLPFRLEGWLPGQGAGFQQGDMAI